MSNIPCRKKCSHTTLFTKFLFSPLLLNVVGSVTIALKSDTKFWNVTVIHGLQTIPLPVFELQNRPSDKR